MCDPKADRSCEMPWDWSATLQKRIVASLSSILSLWIYLLGVDKYVCMIRKYCYTNYFMHNYFPIWKLHLFWKHSPILGVIHGQIQIHAKIRSCSSDAKWIRGHRKAMGCMFGLLNLRACMRCANLQYTEQVGLIEHPIWINLYVDSLHSNLRELCVDLT